MTLEEILSNVNNNIRRIVDELRKRIENISGVEEIVDKRRIIYKYSGKDFCMINIKKDYLEIDFVLDNTIEDPMEFSWKIKPAKKDTFNRRMHIKNMSNIEIVFGLIFQSYNFVK
jgi:predicted transport protein